MVSVNKLVEFTMIMTRIYFDSSENRKLVWRNHIKKYYPDMNVLVIDSINKYGIDKAVNEWVKKLSWERRKR